MAIAEEIKKIIEDSLATLKEEGGITFGTLPEVHVEHPAEMDLGDYATNIALLLAKKEKKAPSEVAGLIIKNISSRGSEVNFLDNIQEVGGFINFFISKERLLEELFAVVKEGEMYGAREAKKGLLASLREVSRGGRKKRKVLVEYSSPNIAKPFGVGHLRSTIIGQAIYNCYNFLGWECIGVNHLGDWGTPHGKIIYQIKEKKLKGKTGAEARKILEGLKVDELERLYVAFHQESKENPKIEEAARAWFKKLEEGDGEAREIWKYMRAVSVKEFERVYDMLGVRIDTTVGESFYEDMLDGVVQECTDKGIARESEGALMVEYKDDVLPPAMLLKSDGATTYFTRDLAAIKYRIKKYHPELFVYEVGAEQTLHFKQVFETARMLGWVRGERLVHVAHGFYRWKHGKFSTRSGDTIHLEDILKEAIERARDIIEGAGVGDEFSEKAAKDRPAFHAGRGLAQEEKKEVARAVGIGAVKYNDLSHNPRGDIIFDWDNMLNLKGNSAPYIQYTYARCMSILHKSEEVKSLQGLKSLKLSQEEIDILRFIYRLPEVVRESAEKFSPNLLCAFVFDLSQKFNLFYGTRSILGAESKELRAFRLMLTEATAQAVHNALVLLGVETPDRI